MIYPSIEELSQGKYNRYTLVIATSKCARMVTDEYVKQREVAEKMLANKETDKSLASMIKREFRDEKAVKNAINRLYQGEFKIVDESMDPVYQEKKIKEREEKTKAEAAVGTKRSTFAEDMIGFNAASAKIDDTDANNDEGDMSDISDISDDEDASDSDDEDISDDNDVLDDDDSSSNK